ncbi:MAG TPA: sulfate adenylyltransferase subunit CysN [Acidimicrobiales bacterium]|nr:sulfate adenylyltransferase subunit CysN [Acidimicrobiales bacterium]
MELLRLATAGSVDDGKSTLIGRLLFDSKAIFEDQLASVERASVQRGHEYTNLALLTDGLRAEREQGITIDVAYRYFATPRRKFIIADTPGHVQYTRNMVTGASTADVAVVLVDARKGLLEQSRRHAFIATLLRIPHLVVAVNKMDLVDWDEGRFRSIVADFSDFSASLLPVADVTFIPLSALQGDNVVDRSDRMPWYEGLPLLEHLETVHIAEDRNLVDMRFPVQYVIRPMSDAHHDYRGYAGQVAGGVIRSGDDVVVLPSGLRSQVAAIDTYDGPVDEAFTGMSVTVRLTDDVDVSRGDMLVRADDQPSTSQDVEAVVCWMIDQPLRQGGRYAIKHTTRWARAMVGDLRYRLDINNLDRDESATELRLNEIGRVRLRVTAPLMHDPYGENRTTGSFILVDEATNVTAGAGMIV